jgi:hypothetical protein
MKITHSFVWVDELPGGAAVALRNEVQSRRDDPKGPPVEVSYFTTYLSRSADPDVLAADLGAAFTRVSACYQVDLKVAG